MKKIEMLKDVLIDIGKIESYFGNTVPIDLWRAKKVKDPKGLFDLVEEEIIRPRGAPRKPDITIEGDWVRVRDRPRGISTFNKPNTFKGKWEYFKIPAGTKLPETLVTIRDERNKASGATRYTIVPARLVIVEDHYNERFGATHYTIAPERDMPLVTFRELLKQLIDLVEKEAVSGN